MFNDATKKSLKSFGSAEAEVREDEEQGIKLNEIIELLVGAGYYRARIKGLSNFDKIVGGMTWCIESCSFGIDVDLLFQENSTIGQKIALTEKIVAVLPKMKCPYQIEPHQIQGLDCIHIYPVIEWLVKESIKNRAEMAEYVRSYAVNQYHKKHSQEKVNPLYRNILLRNVELVKKAYEPLRKFKSKNPVPSDEFSILSNTLLEYGDTLQISQNVINKLQEMKSTMSTEDKEITQDILQKKIEQQKKVEELMKNLSKFDDTMYRVSSNVVGKITNIQAREVADIANQFESLNLKESQGLNLAEKSLNVWEKQKTILENKLKKLQEEHSTLEEKIEEAQNQLEKYRNKKKSIEMGFVKMKSVKVGENKELLDKLEKLLTVHDGLKLQEQKFREQCKTDLNALTNLIQKSEVVDLKEESDRLAEYNELKEIVNRKRLKLAKKNRAIAALTRQLDDIPGRSELTQYQRRFMELYNQVAVKHKETKQYYTLYNTLDDTKLYLSKELSLLNSIQENYNAAMSSNSAKEEFLKQFELIVEEVQKNKLKVEKRCADEKQRRDMLSRQLVSLMEQQRKYVAAVRQLTEECRKNEMLLAKLRGP